MTKDEIMAQVDVLIAARDNLGSDVQGQIDALMEQYEAIVEADPAFVAKQQAAAWGAAVHNNALWF